MRSYWCGVAAMLMLATGSLAHAAQGDKSSRGHQPPEEAFKACVGKSEGDTVSVTMPRGDTLEATCAKFGDKLAARPSRPPGGEDRGPPPDDLP